MRPLTPHARSATLTDLPTPNSPSGREISETFAREWLVPHLRAHHPWVLERGAIARFSGSDLLGFDDELSRDHGWGPTVDILLSPEDASAHASALQADLSQRAPRDWRGARLAGGYDTSVSVRDRDRWVAGHLKPRGRLAWEEWPASGPDLEESDSPLCYLRDGLVIHDGDGWLGDLRHRLQAYPADVRAARIQRLCFQLAHYGEYNLAWRLSRRQDPWAIAIAEGEFVDAVLRLLVVLEGRFPPYWKWLPAYARRLAVTAAHEHDLATITGTAPLDQRIAAVKSLCGRLARQVIAAGVVPDALANPYGIPWFFIAATHLWRAGEGSDARRLMIPM
jgi:hypothetical protein